VQRVVLWEMRRIRDSNAGRKRIREIVNVGADGDTGVRGSSGWRERCCGIEHHGMVDNKMRC
jgi:hypothetical protein